MSLKKCFSRYGILGLIVFVILFLVFGGIVLGTQIGNDKQSYTANTISEKLELLRTNDASISKRDIRNELLESSDQKELFLLSLEYYESSNTEDERIQYSGLLILINVTEFESELYDIAISTKSHDLFLAMIYSLMNTNTKEARQALFRLLGNADNLQNEDIEYSIFETKNLLNRVLTEADNAWISELDQSTLNEYQKEVIESVFGN